MKRHLGALVRVLVREFLRQHVLWPYRLYDDHWTYRAYHEPRDLWVGLYWDVTEYWATAYLCLRPGYVHRFRWAVVGKEGF